MGAMGFLGPTIEGYGCAGVNNVCYGLIAREVERVDSGYRSALSVQSSLVMYPIYAFGSRSAETEIPAETGHRRMDRLLRPDRTRSRLRPRGHGRRAARKTDGGYMLNGAKMWITNAPLADVLLVWAKDDDGVIRGFILEKGMKGLSAPKIEGKFSLRASVTGEDRDGRGVGAGGKPAARGLRPQRTVQLSEQGALTASRGARWARPNSAGMPRATTRWSANSSAGRWPQIS